MTRVAEKPILFSDAMVRAILNGSKTQTRRLITPEWIESRGLDLNRPEDREVALRLCPFGAVGEQLWVRECFSRDHSQFYPHLPVIYRADGYDPRDGHETDPARRGQVFSPETRTWHRFAWKPSIFCTRDASRIQLKIDANRVEQVQDITEADAAAEGMQRICGYWDKPQSMRRCPACQGREFCQARDKFIHEGLGDADGAVTAREAFEYLWRRTYGQIGWTANPWVFVISFNKVKPC